jgi:2-polyprenyl-3-methyl-5-hydroxy-6-metoxy-1,4-benzoquinol methylase
MLKFFAPLSTLFNRPKPIAPMQAALASEPGIVDSRMCGLADAVQSGWFNHASGELLTGFKITAEDVVLDVGCGDGAATLFAARCGAEVIFSDTDAEKIKQLEQRVKSTPTRATQALIGDTNPLPLPDARATRIIATEMLEHVDDPAQVLAELVRVGRPGALYLLSVPDPVGERVQQQIAPASHFKKPNHIHIFERETFATMITDAGLVVESRQSSGFYWTMWMCLYWANAAKQDNPTLDQINPPYPTLLNEWANTWQQLMMMPRGAEVKSRLDSLMPKSQIIIARKPY